MQIKFLIADDKQALCDSIQENVYSIGRKFNLYEDDMIFYKAFTEHAYDHGCEFIRKGFRPDICIFDLVFNGFTGIDLYKYLVEYMGESPALCVYTGVEKNYEKRQEAEELASKARDNAIVVPKPHIQKILDWTEKIIEEKFKLPKQFIASDPFDLL
jgi:hypothetical protein